MISVIDEGDIPQRGINLRRISDGGFAIIVLAGRLRLYFRRRGAGNPAKPRHIFEWYRVASS